MTHIQTNKMTPIIQNAKLAYQLWQILCCCSHANVFTVLPLTG